jgi:prepilin-type N-terminal cleavage/methylation domain-containing protein
MERLLRRLRSQSGYSLPELVAVVAILAVVMGSVTTILVQGWSAEVDLNRRFHAQQEARLALDTLRRDVHCASGAATSATLGATAADPAGSAAVTLTLPAGCVTGSGDVTWCAVGAAAPFALHREAGSTCGATGARWAAALATDRVFTAVSAAESLLRLHVRLSVDSHGTGPNGRYELVDDLVLRNSPRA